MPLEELFVSMIPSIATLILLVYRAGKLGHQIEDMRVAIMRLNHNSSAITKALLAKGVIQPEDIKEVEL